MQPINNAANVMYGTREVIRLYLGTHKVWERGVTPDIPQEVLDNVADLVSHYNITGDYTYMWWSAYSLRNVPYYGVVVFESTSPTFTMYPNTGSPSAGTSYAMKITKANCNYYIRTIQFDASYRANYTGSFMDNSTPSGYYSPIPIECIFDTSNITYNSEYVTFNGE